MPVDVECLLDVAPIVGDDLALLILVTLIQEPSACRALVQEVSGKRHGDDDLG